MKVIAFVNEKGGVGKSTLALNLAAALLRRKINVVLIDADPQSTLRDWRSARPDGVNLPEVVGLDAPGMLSALSDHIAADVAIIDTPARAERITAHAVRVADTVLLPVQPSGADVWASAAAVTLINSKRDLGGRVNAAFVCNRTHAHSHISRDIRAGAWNEYGIELLEPAIANRVAFASSMTNGTSVFELGDASAIRDVQALAKNLEDRAWL